VIGSLPRAKVSMMNIGKTQQGMVARAKCGVRRPLGL